jgi:UDP-N-acetylmuramate-alanine ligase
LIAVFQPHQARRTIEFFDDFIDVLNMFDESYIYDIYTAREDVLEIQKKMKTNISSKMTKIKNVDEL